MGYSFVEHNGEKFEICDECGFNGELISAADAIQRLHVIGDEWRATFALYPELTRERPKPETWCPVEYAVHLVFVVRANEHQAHLFVDGLPVVLAEMPPEILKLWVGDMADHACESRDIEAVLDDLENAFRSLGAYTASLSEDELRRRGAFGGMEALQTDTLGVVRHVLHDAEHHLLDIRRGIALPLVAANPLPV